MRYFIFLMPLFFACQNAKEVNTEATTPTVSIDTLQATSLLGLPLISRQLDVAKDSARIAKYLIAKEHFINDSSRADHVIWFGRRTAYLGDYNKAIEIYSNGINRINNDPRLYRHRGHRYISTRQLDKALDDFKMAVKLIAGAEDQVEPDGIPNAQNIPVSTLHTNIYYHLGLAYYVKNDLDSAHLAFQECLDRATNDDMICASAHWLYMILRRQHKNEEATALLEQINTDMNIIENKAYHELCLFYKGVYQEEDLIGTTASGSNEAILYGLANWYHYNGDEAKAKISYEELVAKNAWPGFGYLAAEADLSRMRP